MSIINIKANLLEWPQGINVIAHSANCQNTMGSGIAKSIREKYPEAYDADSRYWKQFYPDNYRMLGSYSVVKLEDGKEIINSYTQNNYGRDKRYVNYEAFYKSFEDIEKYLRDKCENEKRKITLGVPKNISCFRAGGEWSIIWAMLSYLFADSPVNLVVVEFDNN